ncbi:DNA primase [Xylanibacter muris]|uniref:DNA primase n=1 Tax=Xylanibacter muris TaxID=2736290 RepID=A0ABX2AMZ0_9BACT|nr:DNA primase [Xylanibacter muris]NPD91617.1 DNA primase [Xylanibacter muris]
MIDRATVDRIMDAVNIVDVVSEFVHLRKAGVNYKGLCPFHDDKTPSFMVSPAKGICHCFACGKGGNAVNFVMEHEQMTYPEALRWLAAKYNIEIKEKELTDEEKKEAGERESMFIVNEWAKDYFMNIMDNDPDGVAIGKQYFRSRGFRDDIIKKFQLGFALSQRDSMSKAALAKGYKEEFLVKTGLCYRKDNGELVDRYSGRVIFPWLNVSGKVSAFGGRLLDSRTKGVQQKYVNSPESEIYHKDRELYGLYQAKKAIVKEDRVFMVEGYTDVVSMHQCGIENVVANSGTALSMHQVRLLHRFTSNIVLLYDGDEAGIHAAMRGTDMLLSEGMNIKVLVLPDGDDPDSFSRKHTAVEFRQYIEDNQTDFIEFKTARLLRGVTDPIKRSEAIGSIVRSVSVIPNQIIRDTYLRECSIRLQMSEQTLVSTMNKFIRGDKEEREKEQEREARRRERDNQNTAQPQQVSSAAPSSVSSVLSSADMVLSAADVHGQEVERLLITMVIRHGEEIIYKGLEAEDGSMIDLSVSQYIDYDLSQDGIIFHNVLYNRILEEAVAHNNEPGFRAEAYFMHHPDIEISRIAGQLGINRYQLSASLSVEPTPDSIRQKVTHLVLDYRLGIMERRLKDIQMQLRTVGSDMERIRALMEKYRDTQVVRDALARQIGSDIIVTK